MGRKVCFAGALLFLSLFFMCNVAIAAESDQGASQTSPYYKSGDKELGFRASWTYINSKQETAGTTKTNNDNAGYLDFGVSYYITDNVSIGTNLIGFYVPGSSTYTSGSDLTILGLEPNIEYNFQKWTTIIPYVGLHGGYAHFYRTGYNSDAWLWGGHAGLKFPITKNVYFDTQFKYTHLDPNTNSTFEATYADIKRMDMYQILLGLKIKF